MEGFGSVLTSLEVQQQVVELEEELNVLRQRLAESQAGLAATQSDRRRVEAEFIRAATVELADAEAHTGSREQELIKAEQRQSQHALQAPIDGQVQQLAIHTIGGVVTPAQPLLAVAAIDTLLEVEAMIANKDIGFVEQGEHAEVKLEAFPFTRYGAIPARHLGFARCSFRRETGTPLPFPHCPRTRDNPGRPP